MTTLVLAFLAGILSILSPCVLPLLPIVFGTAAADSKLGPAALGVGVALSFVVIGLFVATVGFSIGLDGSAFRYVAAVLMIAVGMVLLVPRLQVQFAAAGGPVGNWALGYFGERSGAGPMRQFHLGVLLGAVWSPCVGPVLGAASVLAAQGNDLPQVALTMVAFGFGAALPLTLIGAMSRTALRRWRGDMLSASASMKLVLGVLLVALGLLIVTGLDKSLEAFLVEISPSWLTDLTTRI
jgi:cytochrome c biogenesis protein CcdA